MVAFRFCTAAVSCWTSTKNDVSKSAGMAVRAVILETTAGVDADVAAKVTNNFIHPTLLDDPKFTANIHCKSRNLPDTDTQNYSTDLR